jgi:membrane-associated phospholipid phosphatase
LPCPARCPIYNRLDPDVAAAFPSLHAAYPLLAALALWPVARRGAVAAFAWSGMVWFSVVYLGQHYVTDVLGGIVFAAGTWLIMTKILVPRIPSLQRRPARGPALSTPDASRPDIAVPAAQEETAARGPG